MAAGAGSGLIPDLDGEPPRTPWGWLRGFGWFLLGAVIGRTAYRKKQSLLPRVNAANPVIRFFSFCGRHSLLIYMLHQPVLTIGTILIFG